MKTLRGQRIRFSTAHFYQQKLWSQDKNTEVFGPCFRPYGHGHNYVLEVMCSLNSDQFARFKDDLGELKLRVDHRHLNFDLAEFKTEVPTTENILLWFKTHLEKKGYQNLKLNLWELEDLSAHFA